MRYLQPSLFNNFDRLFSDMWDDATPVTRTAVPCEITESEQAYFLSLDAPGMKKDDIKIEVTGNVLSISGERKRTYHEDRKGGGAQERSYGFFNRSFTLPEAIDADRIEANFEDGVLEVAIPKSERAKPRKIEVQSGSGGKEGFFGKYLNKGRESGSDS